MNKILSLRFFQLIAIILICLGIGYVFGTHRIALDWKNYKPILSVQSATPPPGQTIDMTLFYQVLDRLNQDYYDKSKIDTKKVLYGAISGALQSLDDPYTSFFPPQQNTDFKTQLSGEFSGIGAELTLSKDNIIQVMSPLDGSPSIKAGIKAGDLILKVNSQQTGGWTLGQAVEKIRGPKGTKVTLTIVHPNSKTPQDISITRDAIQIKSVTGWFKSIQCKTNDCQEQASCTSCATVAYMRISQFGDKTNDEWATLVKTLSEQIKRANNFRGIILDLRNNPGGYLNDAQFIASEFIKDGVIVKQQDGAGNVNALTVSHAGALTDYPVEVLINGGSASASEIVSGALRDHGRAKLVGEKSFGKGTVQEPVDVDGGASVHISVAKWLTPNGTWVHHVGLKPDIEVKYDEKASSDPTKFDNQLQKAIQAMVQ